MLCAHLERSQDNADYRSRRDAIGPFVDAVIVNGVYEIVATVTPEETSTPEPAAGGAQDSCLCAARAVGSACGVRRACPSRTSAGR